jgi:hypothetical protein
MSALGQKPTVTALEVNVSSVPKTDVPLNLGNRGTAGGCQRPDQPGSTEHVCVHGVHWSGMWTGRVASVTSNSIDSLR